MYKKGDTVYMTDDAIANYGEKWRDVALVVSHVATKYMPASEFFNKGRPDGYHPGYDGHQGEPLYDFEGVPFSLYEWEVRE